MLVRFREGRRAGEVADMPYHFAAPLIRDGRAIALNEEQRLAELAAVAPAAAPEPPKEPQQPQGKHKRR